ncbi:lytic polysaccharide monooxygenase [Microdochium nivale]|nr:lytic polysaccharide monooxygenase [Microdochium nivale]
MISNTQTLLALASLATTVLGHGYVMSPPGRKPGPAMAAACGQQMFNNQNSDFYGNIQGQLQVARGQSDFNADACNVWQCKGYQFADNLAANIQSYTAGQVVPMTIEIRAPHEGTANVSIVSTKSNTIIGGGPLKSFAVYASNAAPIPASQTQFDITIPQGIDDQCAQPGDCVIQWYWDARSIDQTYEACVDFVVAGSGSGTAPRRRQPSPPPPPPPARLLPRLLPLLPRLPPLRPRPQAVVAAAAAAAAMICPSPSRSTPSSHGCAPRLAAAAIAAATLAT